MADTEKRNENKGLVVTHAGERQVSYKELVEETMASLRGTTAEDSFIGYLKSDSEISRYYRNDAPDSQQLFSLIQQYRGTATRLLMSARDSGMGGAVMLALSEKLDRITEMAQRLFEQVRSEIETEQKSSDDTLRSIYDALYNESNAQDDDFDDMTDSFDAVGSENEYRDGDDEASHHTSASGNGDGDDEPERLSEPSKTNGKRAQKSGKSPLMLQTMAGMPVHTRALSRP